MSGQEIKGHTGALTARADHNVPVWDIKAAWRRLRLESKAARHYWQVYSLYIGQTHKDLLLEAILPTLLHVKAVAILDDALELWLDGNGHQLAKPYKDDLNGRLSYMKDKSLLGGVDELQEIRRRRNDFAHKPGVNCDWKVLDDDVASIETALCSLSLVQVTPTLEFYCERSAMEASPEPGISGTRTFKYGVKEDGVIGLEISWTQNFHANLSRGE